MQLAVHAGPPVYDLSPSHSPSTRRSTKFMVAGVAMASAGVIAVSPVAPPMPNIQDIQERVTQAAVQLTAATNPLVAWQQTIANTFASLDTLIDGSSLATENLIGALSTGYIFQEVANVLILNTLNPGPLLDQIVNFNSNYGPVIDTAITQTIERLQLAAEQFPEVLTNTLTYLAQGQFVESFSEINGWFVLRVLGGIRPLIPILDIPGNFAAALPGVEKLDDLLKVVSEFALTKAIFEPVLGGILQSAELLDAARAAFGEGDYVDALTNLANIAPLAFNALVNGMTPAGTTAEWQGLLDRGLVSYLAVTFTNLVANAIKPPVDTTLAFSAQDALAPQAPTEYNFGGQTYTIDNGSSSVDNSGAGAGEGTGDGSADGSGAGSGDGSGAGAGDGSGAGSGDGSGAGAGDGSGDGSGAGDGDGDTGEGSGAGDGDGDTGDGAGDGGGEGAGDGDGDTGTGTGGTTGGGTTGGGTTGGGTTGAGTTGGGTTGGGTTGGGDTGGSGAGGGSGSGS